LEEAFGLAREFGSETVEENLEITCDDEPYQADEIRKYVREAKIAKCNGSFWTRSRLEPFQKFVRMLRSHLDGILPWTELRLSNGAVEGMNNKIKVDQPSLVRIP